MDTTTLKIQGTASEILDVELSNILKCIADGADYSWCLLWITAVGKEGDIKVLDFEKEVNTSPTGVMFDWEKLIDLSDRFYQVIELLVIGDRDKSNLHRYSTDEEMYDRCSYVLELVDSSYWLVRTKNDSTGRRIKSELAGVIEY